MNGTLPTPDSFEPADGSSAASGGESTSTRQQAASAIVGEVLSRRNRGEILSDADVLAAHPSLRPELDAELKVASEVHRIFLAARSAGDLPPAEEVRVHEALLTSPDAELRRQCAVAIHGYSILGEIGSGGQGAIYKAIQEATGKTVAIKVIPGGFLTGSRHRLRFEREARILAKLEHPCIVGILDRGRTADGSLYLVMPFIEGCSLDEDLQRSADANQFDTRRVLGLFVQIARAIAEAHHKGVIHRDLKPANIRVDPAGRPHILDFGLAVTQDATDRLRDITLTGQIVGSLPWTSPEQVSHSPTGVDARTDIYALGVMLYQALTGSFPYTVYAPVREVMDNIAKTVPAPPSQTKLGAARQIDGPLDAIVMRMLAKSPDARYPSSQALVDDLEQYLAGQPLSPTTRPVGSRRRTILRSLLAAVMLASIAGAGWHWATHRPVEVVKLPPVTNSVGMTLVRLPPGRFVMGSPVSESGRDPDELERWVQVAQVHIGTTEVTQEQYVAVMGKLPDRQRDPGGDRPVQSVTWEEAKEFCRRLSERERRVYRLPTEAEWEYACRASSSRAAFGGTGDLDSMGWYQGNSEEHIHPVATKAPNHWGLYDMHGNVAEWCEDVFEPDATTVPSQDLTFNRVVRGGDIFSPKTACRSAARSFSVQAARSTLNGFRVAMESDDEHP